MSDEKPYDPPLVHLPGTKLTPAVVLHRTLNKIDHIKAVLVVIQWNDDTLACDWSQMTTADMCMASMVASDTALTALKGNRNDE